MKTFLKYLTRDKPLKPDFKGKITDQLRVKEGIIELTVKHLGEDLTFMYPFFCPVTPMQVIEGFGSQREIEEGFLPPTMAQIASLVYTAFNPNGDGYSKKIQELVRRNFLWTCTGSLTIPGKGLYIQDYPPIVDGMPNISTNDLERRVEEGELRFVPFGFKTGEMSPRDLAENLYVQALAGKEGAEKLGRVAKEYESNPFLWVLTHTNEPHTRVSLLVSYLNGKRLEINSFEDPDRYEDNNRCMLGHYFWVKNKPAKPVANF